MKRFEFPLERVRQWRQTQLDLEMAAAAALFAELARIGEERQKLELERRTAERSVFSAPSVTAEQLAALDSFRRWADSADAALVRRGAECQQRIDRQRERVLEARRRCQLLDRLKDRSLAGWRAELRREEEALASELYLARRVREGRYTGGPSAEGADGSGEFGV